MTHPKDGAQGGVDVLGILDANVEAAHAEICAAGAEASRLGMLNTPRQQTARAAHGKAMKARAIVAELIEAADFEVIEIPHPDGGAPLKCILTPDYWRLRAALARLSNNPEKSE